MENTGYKGEEKRKKREDRGEEDSKRKKSPLPIDLKLLQTSQLVKLRNLLQNSNKRDATCQCHRKRRER